jgi:hypothetical protein
MTWVDGAIEGLRGVARVFGASGSCYECTLSEVDREILARRTSCALLSTRGGRARQGADHGDHVVDHRGTAVPGGGPLLHRRRGAGEAGLADGTGLMFVGETLETYPITYSEDPYCPSHDRYGPSSPSRSTRPRP